MLAGRPVDTRPATYLTRGEYCRISLSRARGEPDSLYSAHRPASASWAASTSGPRSDWRVALDPAAGAAGPRARCVTAFPIRLAPGGSTKENCRFEYKAAPSQRRWGNPGTRPATGGQIRRNCASETLYQNWGHHVGWRLRLEARLTDFHAWQGARHERTLTSFVDLEGCYPGKPRVDWPSSATVLGAAAMHHIPSENPLGASAPRTLAEVDPPPPHPFWLTLLATLGGLVIPAAAAIAAAVLLGSQTVPHSSRAATLAAGALTVAEAIFAGLGAAALVEAGWRRVGLPGSGPATFLPLRWIRHRIAHRHVAALIQRLQQYPPQPSRESLSGLLDLSRELARRDIHT